MSWAIALSLAGVLLHFSLRGIDWRRVWELIRSADGWLIAVASLIGTTSYFLRGLRWRLLLAVDRPVGLWRVQWANIAGYLANNFLPARAGELVRTAMVSADTGIPAARVLTTALAERLVDVIAIVSWTPVVLWNLDTPPAWMARAAVPAAFIASGSAIALAVLPLFGPALERLLAGIPLPVAISEKIVTLLRNVLEGIRAFHDWGRFSEFVALTAAVWALDALTAMVTARALGMQLGFSAALLLLTGLGLGSALPSTPGYVGIYQYVAVTVLGPFGFSRTDALAFILMVQALGYAVLIVWGLIGLWQYRSGRKNAVSTAVAADHA